MPAGRRRFRLTIKVPDTTRNTSGQVVPVYTTLANGEDLPAELMVATGSETRRGQQTTATQSNTYRINYLTGVHAEARAIIDGRTLEIVSAINPDGRKRFLILECRELANG
jgi:SPP1 family predicted phage head-tail adaptor